MVEDCSKQFSRLAAWKHTTCGSPSSKPPADIITQWGATVTPDNVKEYTAVDPDTSTVYKFVVLQITDEFASTWYYSFTGSWASLIASGSVIYIPSSGYSCGIAWPVKANTSTGAIGAAKSCIGISSLTTTSATIDASAYTFAFN